MCGLAFHWKKVQCLVYIILVIISVGLQLCRQPHHLMPTSCLLHKYNTGTLQYTIQRAKTSEPSSSGVHTGI